MHRHIGGQLERPFGGLVRQDRQVDARGDARAAIAAADNPETTLRKRAAQIIRLVVERPSVVRLRTAKNGDILNRLAYKEYEKRSLFLSIRL